MTFMEQLDRNGFAVIADVLQPALITWSLQM
jgi:hypothetical protein